MPEDSESVLGEELVLGEGLVLGEELGAAMGRRLVQAFELCRFASQLAGRANGE